MSPESPWGSFLAAKMSSSLGEKLITLSDEHVGGKLSEPQPQRLEETVT